MRSEVSGASRQGPRAGVAGAAANWWQALLRLRQGRWGDATMGYLFILPAILLYATFSAWPIVRGLTIAFSDYRFLIPNHQPFNGLANFVEMANDALFWESLGRSLYYTALYTPLNICLALLIAVLISRVLHPVEAATYRVVSYLP